ncbi:MAG TPA: DNA repair protein RadA [Solirubrobacterales bacterium]|nr:DNA repair protein RadA [Solirubrobacterales bacterium]
MAKGSAGYACTECGKAALAWTGQCPACGAWNTLEAAAPAAKASGRNGAFRAAAGKPVPLREVSTERAGRIRTGIGEFDRVLGGGLVPGSLVLLGGSPGIGKSTIAGMALANVGAAGAGTLYVSGEESPAQVRSRAERLGEAALDVPVMAESSLDAVLATVEAERPAVCVIDSVQTLAVGDAAPGSVAAVKQGTGALLDAAKRLDVTMILIGHVTKQGSLAGPRALEHLVDCVLHFEGERERTFRTVRALKNRFGATSEVGVFEMREGGLVEVADASARFVGEAHPAAGSVVLCAMEGTRPLLVEVQALVAPTEVVPPRRTATGVDRNRLALVLAVLARHGGINLSGADVFVNVAGGVRVDEPGADLAIALAVASANSGTALDTGGTAQSGGAGAKPIACFGEVGLTGELRYVAHADRRLAEAKKFGLDRVLAPTPAEGRPRGLETVDTIPAALRAAGAKRRLRAAA